MPVGCSKQMSAEKKAVIMRLQCTYIYFTYCIVLNLEGPNFGEFAI